MIITFKHKELRMYFEKGMTSRINQNHLKRLRFVLAKLNTAKTIEDMNFSGSGLHPLKGAQKTFWSVV